MRGFRLAKEVAPPVSTKVPLVAIGGARDDTVVGLTGCPGGGMGGVFGRHVLVTVREGREDCVRVLDVNGHAGVNKSEISMRLQNNTVTEQQHGDNTQNQHIT